MSLKVSILDAAMPHEMDSTYLSQEQRRGSPLLRSRQRHSLFALVLVGCAGFFLCYLLETAFATSCLVPSLPSFLDSSTHLTSKILRSPENVKIIGLMFYGRAQFTNVLECYLRNNLRTNGGWLDEVHFIANTAHDDDLNWLNNLVGSNPSYVLIDDIKGPWTKLWTYTETLDADTIVVKIDDDVVYMHEEAIPRLVTGLIDHPEAYAVGGNIVNTPHSQFWQYHTGLLLPYLPDPEALDVEFIESWRASELPNYDQEYPVVFDWSLHASPQHDKTRWLPLPPTEQQSDPNFPASSRYLTATPAWNTTWPSPRGGWTMMTYAPEIASWAMAAQIHYSFLAHLEEDSLKSNLLSKYNFMPNHIWNQQYERYSVNFMALRAGKMARQRLFINDEIGITMDASKEHEEPFLIDMGAVVSHFSFGSQHSLLQTDLLERYLGYANEMVCGAGNQKEMIKSNMTRTIH